MLQSPYSALSKKWTLESWRLTSDGTWPGLWLDPLAGLDKDQGQQTTACPPPADFENSWVGMQPCPFFYILSTSAFQATVLSS